MAKNRATPSASPPLSGERFDILPLLPEFLRPLFLDKAGIRRYSEGQTIYFQGDTAFEFYRIVAGTVRLSFIDRDGREVVYIHYGPNDCFGYSDLIDGKGLPHTAEAYSEVEVQVLGRDAFNALRTHRAFDEALLRLLCGYMRLLSEDVADARLDGLPNRLALQLLEMARPNEAGLPAVQASQSELGLMIGATRQWVNKLLREFQDDGLVQLTYGKVILRDMNALKRRAKDSY